MSNPVEIIRKKRLGGPLTPTELNAFFGGYLEGSVKDYQASALLMAITIQGMSLDETANLTKIMRDSGRVLKWNFPRDLLVDKHSTGGIGDKTSMILLPLCVLEGLKVPMISGRGLGHTGGTLDKLESIPGTNVRLEISEAEDILTQHGGVFLGQTSELAPLDKKLYSLRDVTATVESIPLITASILSKKAAEGIGSLVMDVKYGSGAFIPDFDKARQLAQSILNVGKACALNMRCLMTNMNSPLGLSAGNGLEIIECLEVLKGGGPADTRTLSIELATEMVHMAFPKRDKKAIAATMAKNLASGAAFELFCKIIADQGGDRKWLDTPSKFTVCKFREPVFARSRGRFVTSIDVRALGLAILELGGGRKTVDDTIDHAVGLTNLKHAGDEIAIDEPLAIIHANDERQLAQAKALIEMAYQLGDSATQEPLVRERIA